jgi:hypothetical protein
MKYHYHFGANESMRPTRFNYFPIIITAMILSMIQVTLSQTGSTQQDTIIAQDAASIPLVNGQGNDDCWLNIP